MSSQCPLHIDAPSSQEAELVKITGFDIFTPDSGSPRSPHGGCASVPRSCRFAWRSPESLGTSAQKPPSSAAWTMTLMFISLASEFGGAARRASARLCPRRCPHTGASAGRAIMVTAYYLPSPDPNSTSAFLPSRKRRLNCARAYLSCNQSLYTLRLPTHSSINERRKGRIFLEGGKQARRYEPEMTYYDGVSGRTCGDGYFCRLVRSH